MELYVPTRPHNRWRHRADPEEHHRRTWPRDAARAEAGADFRRSEGSGRHADRQAGSGVMDFGLSQDQQILRDAVAQIGRASGRGRVCQNVSISVVAVTLKKKKKKKSK